VRGGGNPPPNILDKNSTNRIGLSYSEIVVVKN